MKGQLPIIIAFLLVTAILISTTIYLSTIPVNVKFNYVGQQYSDWNIYDYQLNQLLKYMLYKASLVAEPVILKYIRSNVFSGDIKYGIVYAPYNAYFDLVLRGKRYPRILSAKYFTVKVPVGKEFFNLTYSTYSPLELRFISTTASNIVNSTAYNILNSWIKILGNQGFRVVIDSFTSCYNLTMNRVGGSISSATILSINFTITIFNTLGEFRVYNKTSVLYVNTIISRGNPFGADNISGGIILPILLKTYLMINGKKYYYILSANDIKTEYYSPFFSIIPAFEYVNRTTNIIQAFISNGGNSIYYRGDGIYNVSLIIRYTSDDNFINQLINYIHFSCIDRLITPSISWDKVYELFNQLTSKYRIYYNTTNKTYIIIHPYNSSTNITSIQNYTEENIAIPIIRGLTANITYITWASYPRQTSSYVYVYFYVIYDKQLLFYAPGVMKISIYDTQIIVPLQLYLYYAGYYQGDYYIYYYPNTNTTQTYYDGTLSFDLEINATV